jgi:ACS family hexuronate transporter-like MFS transporter
MIMFSICALAYLVAWSVMKLLVPVHQEITLSGKAVQWPA